MSENAGATIACTAFAGEDENGKKLQFGACSEKSCYDSPEQLSLFNEAEYFALESASEPGLVEVEKQYRAKHAEAKDRIPEDLPVVTVEHFLPEDEQSCPACGKPLHIMGKTVTRRLKIIPAQVSVAEDVCYTYACRNCERTGIEVPVICAPHINNVIREALQRLKRSLTYRRRSL